MKALTVAAVVVVLAVGALARPYSSGRKAYGEDIEDRLISSLLDRPLKMCDLEVENVCQEALPVWRHFIPRRICECPSGTVCDMRAYPKGACELL
ncbi:Hypp9000 [Branchiostoma lanceolatum]|uniref:Hypp9000 protein n=1 Tax=Branchiostoma lanceolatum TaxID=7740 RepID=A0A8J9ZCY3_BRALA|nr:Hypp9000 [Branchiostoma lanceolatum]